MDRIQVNSTSIASVGYDEISMTLEIEFLKGSVYQYFDVPEIEHRNLIGAESIGRYLNQNIIPNYRCAQV